VVAILSLSTVVLAVVADPPAPPEDFMTALARVTGRTGAATGIALNDSTVHTDGRLFSRVGDTVALTFPVTGQNSLGVVNTVTWATGDSVGGAILKILGGAITPNSLPFVGAPQQMDARVTVACVGGTGAAVAAQMRFQDVETALDDRLPDCDAGTVVVDPVAGGILAVMHSSARGSSLRLISWTAIGRPR
jgi:hypothetical protein